MGILPMIYRATPPPEGQGHDHVQVGDLRKRLVTSASLSSAILSHVRMLWYCGMALGLVGSVIGLSAMFM